MTENQIEQAKEIIRRKGVLSLTEIAAYMCIETRDVVTINNSHKFLEQIAPSDDPEFITVTNPYGEVGVGLKSWFLDENSQPKKPTILDRIKRFLGMN